MVLCMFSTIRNGIEYGISMGIGMKFGINATPVVTEMTKFHYSHFQFNTCGIYTASHTITSINIINIIPQVSAVFGLLGNYELYYGIRGGSRGVMGVKRPPFRNHIRKAKMRL